LFHKYSELLAGFKPGFVMEMSWQTQRRPKGCLINLPCSESGRWCSKKTIPFRASDMKSPMTPFSTRRQMPCFRGFCSH